MTKQSSRMTFKVKGVHVEKNQKVLSKYVRKLKKEGYFSEPYDGMSNKEIKEDYFDQIVYEYDYQSLPPCKLLTEDDNKYDSNAILVCMEDLDKKLIEIGHVPKELCLEIREIMKNSNYITSAYLLNGKGKIADYDEYGEKIIFKTLNHDYGIEIYLNWE